MKKQGSITGLAQEVFMEYVEKSSAYDFAINQLLIDITNEFNAVYDSADIDFTIESLPFTAQEEFIKRAFQIVV
ncbi:hypothetical protein [Lachnoanaerobaculum orale]|uniref:hypothetical protein n=1 Tax=Lachnoanaerobaculum orale TaxID=979627 RepID=UPI0023A84F1D|nr:hypothetical protein [Lachnoanaerobaculum orale]